MSSGVSYSDSFSPSSPLPLPALRFQCRRGIASVSITYEGPAAPPSAIAFNHSPALIYASCCPWDRCIKSHVCSQSPPLLTPPWLRPPPRSSWERWPQGSTVGSKIVPSRGSGMKGMVGRKKAQSGSLCRFCEFCENSASQDDGCVTWGPSGSAGWGQHLSNCSLSLGSGLASLKIATWPPSSSGVLTNECLEQNANRPYRGPGWMLCGASLGHVRVTGTEVSTEEEPLLHPSHILYFFIIQLPVPDSCLLPHPEEKWHQLKVLTSLKVDSKDTKKMYFFFFFLLAEILDKGQWFEKHSNYYTDGWMVGN